MAHTDSSHSASTIARQGTRRNARAAKRAQALAGEADYQRLLREFHQTTLRRDQGIGQ